MLRCRPITTCSTLGPLYWGRKPCPVDASSICRLQRRQQHNNSQRLILQNKLIRIQILTSRAVDSHSFFAHPDPAFFLNADQDPALKICTNHLIKSFLELTDKKDCYKVKTFFFINVSLLDPDPGGKINEDPCGSESIALGAN